MTLWQYFCLLWGLTGFRDLVIGKKYKKSNDKDSHYALICTIITIITSYYALDYSLPILINLIKEIMQI